MPNVQYAEPPVEKRGRIIRARQKKVSIFSWMILSLGIAMLFLPLIILAIVHAPKAHAQENEIYWYYWQRAALAGENEKEKGRVTVMLNNAASSLQDYYKSNKSLPRFDNDMDKFMSGQYKSIMSKTADSGWSPSTAGSQRTFGNMRMFYDSRAGNIPRVNNKYQFPQEWGGEADSVAIATDGNANAVVYYIGPDQKPMGYKVVDCDPSDDKPAVDDDIVKP